MAFKLFDRKSTTTPNVFISEGLTPDRHIVASYLPLIRYDKVEEDYKVISAGKPIALDEDGFMVPAGLAVQLRAAFAAAGNYNFGTGQANRITRYTQTDVDEGVKNSLGEAVKVGEPVIWSFFATNAGYTHQATMNLDTSSEAVEKNVGGVIGLIMYDAFKQNGAGFTNNPVNYSFNNYNMQASVGLITEYYIEVPVLANYTVYDAMPFKETACFIGASSGLTTTSSALSLAGTLTSTYGVKVDAGSNFALWVKGTDAVDEKVGNVIRFLGSSEFPKNALNLVKTWPGSDQSNWGALDKVPGDANGGLPAKLAYAGLTGSDLKLVRIHFKAR